MGGGARKGRASGPRRQPRQLVPTASAVDPQPLRPPHCGHGQVPKPYTVPEGWVAPTLGEQWRYVSGLPGWKGGPAPACGQHAGMCVGGGGGSVACCHHPRPGRTFDHSKPVPILCPLTSHPTPRTLATSAAPHPLPPSPAGRPPPPLLPLWHGGGADVGCPGLDHFQRAEEQGATAPWGGAAAAGEGGGWGDSHEQQWRQWQQLTAAVWAGLGPGSMETNQHRPNEYLSNCLNRPLDACLSLPRCC